MPGTSPSGPLDATIALRGLVNTLTQVFEGQKTFRLSTAASGERALTAGTSVADASVNGGFSLFSARTGLGGTEREYFRIARPTAFDQPVVTIDQQNNTNTRGLYIVNTPAGVGGLKIQNFGGGYLALNAQQSGSPHQLYAENKGLEFSQNANSYDTTTLMRFIVANPAGAALATTPVFDFRADAVLQTNQKLARWQVNGGDVAHIRAGGSVVVGANTANPVSFGFAADLANVADGFKYNIAASEIGVFSSNNSAFIGLNLGTGNSRASGSFTSGGNFESSLTSGGLILKSPDGTRWKLTITNAGATSVALA